jgi:rubredoxin
MNWHKCAVCGLEFETARGLRVHAGMKQHNQWQQELDHGCPSNQTGAASVHISSNRLGSQNESPGKYIEAEDALSASSAGVGSIVSFPTGGCLDNDQDADEDDDNGGHEDSSPAGGYRGVDHEYSDDSSAGTASSVASSNSSYCNHPGAVSPPPRQGAVQPFTVEMIHPAGSPNTSLPVPIREPNYRKKLPDNSNDNLINI